MFEGVTTGTPISLLIRNQDQRSKDYGNIADTFRPGHADYAYLQKIRPARPSRRRALVGARDRGARVAAGAIAKKWLKERHGIVIRACMRVRSAIEIPFSPGTRSTATLLRAQRRDRARARGLHGRAAQVGRLHRRAHRRGRQRRAGRLGRAGVWRLMPTSPTR